MLAHGIGAVMVVDNDALTGIVSEFDVVLVSSRQAGTQVRLYRSARS
jgi:CBS domain-containing protein